MVRDGLSRRAALGRLGALAAAAVSGCVTPDRPTPPQPPEAPREFRGAWIASVSNIDWPSRPGLSVEMQQEEARNLVRVARYSGLNALILQVRPAGDALFASPFEPWSEYLTGEQGRAPQPFYDPLAFWVEEAHRAGLELHAWFNPYRARHSSARSALDTRHIANTHPRIVKAYGDQLWMDPGEPAAADRALAVILDVIRRYDVDGIHIDDYFYPYPVKGPDGQDLAFPDDDSWRRYVASGGRLARADWRRANVDALVERIYREVRRASDRVRVGVSPFGVGRPDRRPAGIAGFSQFDAIYADVERWLDNGWLDYLAPQLYWKSDSPEQPFAPLLAYWRAQNPQGRDIWPGLFTSRIDASENSWTPDEIAGQVALSRAGGANGHIHFSMAALAQNRRGIVDRLRNAYATPALVPRARWIDREPPPAPSIQVSIDAGETRITSSAGPAPWLLATWARYGDTWRFFVIPRGDGRIPATGGGRAVEAIVVSAVDRYGFESRRVRTWEK